ncbi:probable 2-oxoglutarate-dependent dioxygenase SLC1 [Salvia miltiorrhiza]|uniref:probable 2-oxoglutarate-dependent dioxygenase SLC1 n=1 Tax=Salvia miltiorrhiza TaxID=226208 RepID=UPI0025AC5161|nr:probable 2-oxoglutarate-dependent dioxygenase SLC1 [Salvia miltiorrhiza]
MSPAIALMSRARNDDPSENLYEKGVKNMYENGIEHVPRKYVLPASERPNVVISDSPDDLVGLHLPVIDFAQLQGPDRSQALQSLAHACENFGFFQLVNHGIAEEVTEKMVNVGKRFFEMALSEREKYMTGDIKAAVRYGTSFNQNQDGVFCWRDFLKLNCHPLPQHLPHWPSSPLHFRQSAACYAEETRALFVMVVEAILESLGLNNKTEKESILKEMEDASQLMVVNCYPPCPQPDLTVGMPPHSDYGFLTLLLQDDVEGLQILHKHRWLTVRPIPGSFVVNVGDHLEIFSNGQYKSVLHRVLVNSMNCRVSVASLLSFPFTTTVRPAAKLITETNPRRYKDTDFATFLEYIKSCDSKNKSFLQSRRFELNDESS